MGRIPNAGPEFAVVHLLRAVTVELDLLGGEFAQRNGLHPTDLRALICLLDAARSGTPATPGRLGAQLKLNSAGTTALLDRLERLGLVRRTRDDKDRRRVLLVVQEQAVVLGETFFGPLIGALVGMLRDYAPEEVAVVQRFLGGVAELVAQRRQDG
ncbi:MarR family transcriptional regulator [Kitasatospora sp. RB6PN24]|uniref:MarR family transcriptional regulator n=1 Tax=Kitasatospora humi TaxID=2893891 RepID=UPI001E3E2DA3|nr:MarR family transcriptional regulator [Kitasatospora humi]MCC9307424.1 MarR family transcriptional regulator [Kitasatospora humi]